ncbi:TPA: biotin/lipoyl-binding protein [Acinetobacter baumannii]|nr:biotin/lipoyl-binding protein [Acinetobacter baumannii]
MNKKLIAVVLVVIAIVIISFWVWKYNNKNQKDNVLTLYGNVDIRQVSLAFEQSGRIEKLLVQEGDKVKAGQVLATLNTNALHIQAKQAQAQLKAQQEAIVKQDVGARPEEITQAKAQLASAQAELDKTNKNLQRLQILVSSTDGRAISQQELDYAKSNKDSAEAVVRERQANLELIIKGARQEDREATKAQYEVTKANLDLINYNLTQAELKSPVNAVVRARSVAEFTPKTVQTEEIRTTLVYEVRVYVNDPNDQLKMGQPVTVKVPLASGEKAHD